MLICSDNNLIKEAQDLASYAHSMQKYGDEPYYVHLEFVAKFLYNIIHKTANVLSFFDAVGLANIDSELIAAAYLHDLLEDAGFAANYNDLKTKFGIVCADICFALQSPKGKNRRERHSKEYFDGIRDTDFAFLVKISDIYVNMRFSYETGSSMLKKYLQEQENLVEIWKAKKYTSNVECYLTENAWYELDNLISDITS